MTGIGWYGIEPVAYRFGCRYDMFWPFRLVPEWNCPHLLTIRERISVGKCGGPVSAALLRDLFDQNKEAIDQSIESENGALTHFEVFTAISFLLFSRENVDIAIVEALGELEMPQMSYKVLN